MYKRDYAHKKAMQSANTPDNLNRENSIHHVNNIENDQDYLWDEYRRLRNFVTAKIDDAKQAYFGDITPKLQNDSKSV